MAETLQLQTLKCPNCTRQISSFSKFSSTVTCPSCSSVIKNPMVESKSIPTPERIIPFSTDEAAFEQSMVNALVNTDYVDKEVFSGINTDNVFRAYLPMYLFEGTYNASWSCESSYMDQQVKISNNVFDSGKSIKTKDVKKWRPQNGTATGNFAFLCLANEGSNDLPEELRQFSYNFPYEVMCSKAFDGDLLTAEDEKLISIPMNADAAHVWQKHGKEMVDRTAENAALNQIGNQEIRNFRATTSFQLSNKGQYVLAPFWFVYYNFKNNRYYYLMDGMGQTQSLNYPIDEEDVAFTKSKERITTIVNWLWLLCIALIFVIGFVPALISLGVWFIAKFIVKKIMNNQIKAKLEESRNRRQEAAQAL